MINVTGAIEVNRKMSKNCACMTSESLMLPSGNKSSKATNWYLPGIHTSKRSGKRNSEKLLKQNKTPFEFKEM